MKRNDIYLAIAILCAVFFMGGLTEYVFKIGHKTVNYGHNDTLLTISKPDTTHDTITETIVSVIVKHDTVTNTVVSYPMDGFDSNDSVAIYSTGKKYKNGDSISVAVQSAILPKSLPIDWVWYLDRYKASDSCFDITRLDTVQVFKQARFGVGPSVGFGYTEKGWTGYVGLSLNFNLLVF